ncbi:hypothetical protein [Endozoicomonas atrinae]|uniref:hypothetical protein n=1 Tax=Endozoicomonas atrinae TaxID=1333660 RepID=UPI000825B9D9|nr:hypothetical protein [Endozoicomonas atrinae]
MKRTESTHVIPNNTPDAHVALVSEDMTTREKSLVLEPVIAWEVRLTEIKDQDDQISRTHHQLMPIVASGSLADEDYAVYYKSSHHWYINESGRGMGSGSCIEALSGFPEVKKLLNDKLFSK